MGHAVWQLRQVGNGWKKLPLIELYFYFIDCLFFDCRCWEEPHDESVYCLATDRVNCLVTGTARHGRVRVWDMRAATSLYSRHAAAARRGQSSPVYSLALDAANMYVALDQSLNHWGYEPDANGKRQNVIRR